jgi:hypothetical protein
MENGPSGMEDHRCKKAMIEGNRLANEDRHLEAYRIFRRAMLGFGDTEYSRFLTWFLKTSMKGFCSRESLDFATIYRFERAFKWIFKYAMEVIPAWVGVQLCHLASSEGDAGKARKLRMKGLFFMLMVGRPSDYLEHEIRVEMERLGVEGK